MLKPLTRDEQRRRSTNDAMIAVGLECHLRNLVREIHSGEFHKLQEFQQFVQYAPPEMKENIRKFLDRDEVEE